MSYMCTVEIQIGADCLTLTHEPNQWAVTQCWALLLCQVSIGCDTVLSTTAVPSFNRLWHSVEHYCCAEFQIIPIRGTHLLYANTPTHIHICIHTYTCTMANSLQCRCCHTT